MLNQHLHSNTSSMSDDVENQNPNRLNEIANTVSLSHRLIAMQTNATHQADELGSQPVVDDHLKF